MGNMRILQICEVFSKCFPFNSKNTYENVECLGTFFGTNSTECPIASSSHKETMKMVMVNLDWTQTIKWKMIAFWAHK